MPATLSWYEIRNRAVNFSKIWANETSEDAEAKSFWDAFFDVFGISRRRVASFEEPVKKADGKGGFIDLLWKGKLIVEHKSRGRDLDRATRQALDYFPGLTEKELPRYVVVSDFARFRLDDLETGERHEFTLAEFPENIHLFGFIAGYSEIKHSAPEDAVNIIAAERLGKLHDLLKASGYEGHPLEVLLVRLLFCLFAEDSTLFEPLHVFENFIEDCTAKDGSDLGAKIAQLFQILDTPREKRQKNLDDSLAQFPYVDGHLFSENIPIASFDASMRDALLECARLDWSKISPAIFGSLFQSIMNKEARRNLGAHYTTEHNILKALNPLFLDDLRAERESLRGRGQKALEAFHEKLASIRVLDPACGCGNFLTIAYRELRELELDVLKELYKKHTSLVLDVAMLVKVNVDQFYGIEIEDYPAQIAQVSLWLTDHQMNMKVSAAFGTNFVRLPLMASPHIVTGNALTLDWASVVKPSVLSYIVGNPPFKGASFQNEEQKEDVRHVFYDNPKSGYLDYVSCWYRKAVDFMSENKKVSTAFVSTNSITQGIQTSALWSDLVGRGVKIHFAHKTFQWESEAPGRAAVHCVIIGFGLTDSVKHTLYSYDDIKRDPIASNAKRINPYLVDADTLFIDKRTRPIDNAPEIIKGSLPADGGNLILTQEEKTELLEKEPQAKPWIRLYLGADEFLNGIKRYCLWLVDADPKALRTAPDVLKRVEGVKKTRLVSKKAKTRKDAATPTLFQEIRQPQDGIYLALPEVSSERREYIPIGYLSSEVIASNKLYIVPNASLYHFGVLTSTMHMAWTRTVTGRLKSDYQYSAGIVYNNFVWCEPTDAQRDNIEETAQGVLDARAKYPNSSLADLYDPLTMPADLLKAHQRLDKAVDTAYRKKAFHSEAERVAFLFDEYRKKTSII